MELPYGRAKEMLPVDDVDNKDFLRELLETIYEPFFYASRQSAF